MLAALWGIVVIVLIALYLFFALDARNRGERVWWLLWAAFIIVYVTIYATTCLESEVT